MKHLKRSMLVCMLSIVLPSLLLAAGGAEAASLTCGTWNVVASPNEDPSDNVLRGVATVSASNVWAVGDSLDASGANPLFHTLIEHWNGTSWKVVASPNVGSFENHLNGVAVVSASNVWTVGNYLNGNNTSQTLIEHWNGTSWSVVASPNVGLGDNFLNAVTVVSASDIWAVGSFITDHEQTLIEHWNGSKWSVVSSPNVGSESNHLKGVAAASASNIWAVGSHGGRTLIEHWNGTQWNIIASPSPGSESNELTGVARVPGSNQVWTVGLFLKSSGGTQTLVEHWNGTNWSVVTSPNVGSRGSQLAGIAAISASNIWAVGYYIKSSGLNIVDQTLIEQWNGTSWNVVASPNVGSFEENHLNAIAASSANNVWAVGRYDTSSGIGMTLTEFFC